MRIIWNTTESYFQAELGLNEFWRDDMELVRSVGFKCTGSPNWIWHTSKVSLLDKLRDKNPKSGLAITEAALEKYKFLSEQAAKKKELKKTFQKAQHSAHLDQESAKQKTYTDPETGLVCWEVSPVETPFTWKYIPPPAPEVFCFVCGDPVYNYEQPDLCLYCAEKF